MICKVCTIEKYQSVIYQRSFSISNWQQIRPRRRAPALVPSYRTTFLSSAWTVFSSKVRSQASAVDASFPGERCRIYYNWFFFKLLISSIFVTSFLVIPHTEFCTSFLEAGEPLCRSRLFFGEKKVSFREISWKIEEFLQFYHFFKWISRINCKTGFTLTRFEIIYRDAHYQRKTNNLNTRIAYWASTGDDGI